MDIKVVILCGGRGTRIRGVADDLPKPMIPIADKPILWHVMKLYETSGFDDFVLCLGHKGWRIKEFFLNYGLHEADLRLRLGSADNVRLLREPPERWSVTLAETGLETQTAGRLWKARPYLEDSELFCVTYGDGVADVDLAAVLKFHRGHGRAATVTGVRPPGRFGDLVTSGPESLVSAFAEKPQTTAGWINGGFFVFDDRLWSYLSGEADQVLEREPLERLAQAGQLAMYPHDGFWQPMDTYREWSLLNELWSSGRAPWKTWV